MQFLRKLLGRGERVPEWARFLDGEAFELFTKLVRTELASRNEAFDLDAVGGTVKLHSGDNEQTLGLLNVAQQCALLPREEWPATVRQHFQILLAGAPGTVALVDALSGSFAEARSYLKVRLQPSDYAGAGVVIVSEPVADDLISVLVYDLPESVATVHPDHVASWGVPLHDLFQLGLRNVRAEGLLTEERIEVGDGAWLAHYEDHANYFGSAHALLLHEYFSPMPDLGVLVSVPNRHGMVVHAMDELSAIKTSLHAMLYFTPKLYQQGPGSVAQSLYWCRHGVFTRLPYEAAPDGSVTFTPPDSFFDQVLERIEALER